MIQSNSCFNKQQKVPVIRDFPRGCGTQSIGSEVVAVKSESFEEVESFQVIMKKAGFNVSTNANNVGSGRFLQAQRKFTSSFGSKVKPLSSEETIKLIASQSKRRQLPYSSTHIQRTKEHRNSCKKTKLSNASESRPKSYQLGHIPNRITKVISPQRKKVLEVLHDFQHVFKELDRQKANWYERSNISKIRIDHKARTILMKMEKQVNNEKMIGSVPGIEVGDEFQYKSELSLIGLHFKIMGGIDYMYKGEMKVATSIVASEGNGYNDIFKCNEVIYSGEGGNVSGKDGNEVEDQKLINGNLALANSMKLKTPVRVIRGKIGSDQLGKRYVYDGLYLVKDCWKEIGTKGNVLFKFKLFKIHA